MALINRMSRLFTADVHAVLDRIEEPDVLLKHAIREMEEELARSEQRVRQLEHEREPLADRHRKVQAALTELAPSSTFASRTATTSSRARSSSASSRPRSSASTSPSAARRREGARGTPRARRRAARAARRHAAEGRAARGRAERRGRRMGPRRLHRQRRRGRGRAAARAPDEEAVMSARDRSAPRPSFGASLGVGLVLSLCGAAALSVLAPLLLAGLRAARGDRDARVRLRALSHRQERRARRTSHDRRLLARRRARRRFAGLPLAAYVLVHVGLIWLVRSLYYYSGVLPALADFGLGLLGAVFAVWAAQRTGSAWLAFWCFFLAQSFHVLIPHSLAHARAPSTRRRRRVRPRAPRRRRGGPPPLDRALSASIPSTRDNGDLT